MSEQQTNADQRTTRISDAILLMMSLLVINQILIDKFSQISKERTIRKIFNPPMITTTIGIVAGAIMNLIHASQTMDQIQKGFTQLFLIILLPPILYDSAINMETQPFFKHFGTIILIAFCGTFVAILITTFFIWFAGLIGIAKALSLELAFAYGSLISATDPVSVIGALKLLNIDKMLNILIFGESILNDAVALICFQVSNQIYQDIDRPNYEIILDFIGSFVFSVIIGLITGILTAYVIQKFNYKNPKKQILKKKSIDSLEQIEHIESSLMLLIPWVSYLIAEALQLSGIVSIIFCGISMARYALPNLSVNGRKSLLRIYNSLAHTFEDLVFLFIGIGLIGFQLAWREMGAGLFLVTFVGIQVARFANIKLSCIIANKFRNRSKIDQKYQFVLWFSGFRGAMAYALSLESVSLFGKEGLVFLNLTLLIVVINIYLQGGLLLTVFEFLGLENIDQQNEQEQPNTGLLAKIKSAIGMFDDKIIQATHIDENQKQELELQ